jgi:DNA-directed RNA polymerase specialized sigma24 family protein
MASLMFVLPLLPCRLPTYNRVVPDVVGPRRASKFGEANTQKNLSQTAASRCYSIVDALSEGAVEMKPGEVRFDIETVFQAQYRRIARVIPSVIRDPARAEDIAVEVFVKWSRNPSAHGENAEGWSYRAAVRMARNECAGERVAAGTRSCSSLFAKRRRPRNSSRPVRSSRESMWFERDRPASCGTAASSESRPHLRRVGFHDGTESGVHRDPSQPQG